MLQGLSIFAYWLISPSQILRRWGGIGLLVLGILDSSIVPTFGSLDISLVLLSARHNDIWTYYAAMSTAGALIGGFIDYELGRRAGMEWIEKRLGTRRSEQARFLIDRWGFGAVVVPTLAPPPFPTAPFLIAAGAVRYSRSKFFSAMFVGRALRYGLLAFIAAHYGRSILGFLRHPTKYLLTSILITSALVAIIAAALFFRNRAATPSVQKAS